MKKNYKIVVKKILTCILLSSVCRQRFFSLFLFYFETKRVTTKYLDRFFFRKSNLLQKVSESYFRI